MKVENALGSAPSTLYCGVARVIEYDLRGGVRGKYFERYKAGTNVVLLEPDVAKVFRDSATVNEALRRYSTSRATTPGSWVDVPTSRILVAGPDRAAMPSEGRSTRGP
jgi:hypothetical protein